MFFKAKGWDDEIRFGGGGIEFSRRLIEYEPDLRKQIYVPDAIIYHDYAVNEEHISKKKAKQEKSKARLRKKFPDIDLYIQQWTKTFRRNDLLIRKIAKKSESKIEKNNDKKNPEITVITLATENKSDLKKTLYSVFRQQNVDISLFVYGNSNENYEDIDRLLQRQKLKSSNVISDLKESISIVNGEVLFLESGISLKNETIYVLKNLLNDVKNLEFICLKNENNIDAILLRNSGSISSNNLKISSIEDLLESIKHLNGNTININDIV